MEVITQFVPYGFSISFCYQESDLNVLPAEELKDIKLSLPGHSYKFRYEGTVELLIDKSKIDNRMLKEA